jgi:nucleotide-binding universal stress UspA family protein
MNAEPPDADAEPRDADAEPRDADAESPDAPARPPGTDAESRRAGAGSSEAPFYERVLFCTDFSGNADFAFEFALDAVRRRPGSTLMLLHVIPEPEAQFWNTYIYELDDVDEKARKDLDAKIDQAYRPRVPEGIPFEVHFRIGRDYQQILRFAAEQNVDLIVIGRQGRSDLGKFFFGSVTEKITRKATCAVLVVPASYENHGDDA